MIWQKAASFSIYARDVRDNWMVLPQTFELPDRIRIAIFSQPAVREPQPVQVLEFSATWVDQLARTPPEWPTDPFRVEQCTFDGDRFSITTEENVVRFHIDKTKHITVYSTDAEISSISQLLLSERVDTQNFPITSRVLAPDVWVAKMEMEPELENPLHPSTFEGPRKYSIHPKFQYLMALGAGFLVILFGWRLALLSPYLMVTSLIIVSGGSVLIGIGALGLMFERW